MGQVLIRNVPDDVIETYKAKARLSGTSLEQYLRNLLEAHKPYTRAERVAVTKENHARFSEPLKPETLVQIREGSE